jgi:two-component system chemotaxis response regulator CheY
MAKIVFCEDEPFLQQLVLYVLECANHAVFVASNGEEGLALVLRYQPDLLLTDIAMPKMDGFQLARAVREDPRLTSLPIIFLTAFTQSQYMEEAKRYGAAGYIMKPFSGKQLQCTIEEAIMGGNSDEERPW